MDVLPGTAHQLLARVAEAQTNARLPSLVGGVVRDGSLAWSGGRGRVGDGPPGADTQYRIGSISKTFTAVLVMRLRDEGALALTDRFEAHVPGSPFGDRTVGQLLSHGAGLQAETSGEWWERTPVGSWDEVLAQLDEHATPHAPGRRFHYSNLGFGALGELVARKRGRPWFDVLSAEVLEPLELRRTTYRPVRPTPPATPSTRGRSSCWRSPSTTRARSRPPASCGRRWRTWGGSPRSCSAIPAASCPPTRSRR